MSEKHVEKHNPGLRFQRLFNILNLLVNLYPFMGKYDSTGLFNLMLLCFLKLLFLAFRPDIIMTGNTVYTVRFKVKQRNDFHIKSFYMDGKWNGKRFSSAYPPLHCLHAYKITPLRISMVIEGQSGMELSYIESRLCQPA